MIAVLTFGSLAGDVGRSLREGLFMFWETLWALVLGFTISGAVQAFVPREGLQKSLGGRTPGTFLRATLYGAASSSCSYAAAAMARTLFSQGADLVASLVFMTASTNLVVELGIVLLVLIGWQFLAAEVVGGIVMIALLAVLGCLWLRGAAVARARAHVLQVGDGRQTVAGDEVPVPAELPWRGRLRQPGNWADAAGYTVGDVRMLRREILIGFVVAGFLTELVPVHIWAGVFFHGHGLLTTVENAVVGPLVAVASFVCSVGNIPLAAALWHGGTSFAGVISFIFADLISMPLLLIYRKQYGWRTALRMLGVMWLVMSVAGLVTQGLFAGLGLMPARHPRLAGPGTIGWNYSTLLDFVALAVLVLVYWAAHNRARLGGGTRYVHDPVCGMPVSTRAAAAELRRGSEMFYFCSPHCAERFVAQAGAISTP